MTTRGAARRGADQVGAPELAFFSSPIADREEVAASAARVRRELERCLPAGGRGPAALPVACVLTGGTEARVLDWLAAREREKRPDDPGAGSSGGPAPPDRVPVVLLALPQSNSLPACFEILARLRQVGRAGRIVVFERGGWREELVALWTMGRTASFLRTARLGLLGGPSAWLVASSTPAGLVREVWGPTVVELPLTDLIARARRLAGPDLVGEAASLRERALGVVEPTDDALVGALALARALREVVSEHGLDAVTLRCFDLLEPLGNTGCLALALLNDEGVTAACEGDIPATLTMMLLQSLTGRPCFMANPSDLDPERGLVTFAHCTVPLGLVTSFRLRSHFESRTGVGVEGRLADQEVTVARVGGPDLRGLEVFHGTVTGPGLPGLSGGVASARGTASAVDPGLPREDLCRTQVTVDVGREQVLRLLERPLGNHHVICPGRHTGAVRTFAELFLPAPRLM